MQEGTKSTRNLQNAVVESVHKYGEEMTSFFLRAAPYGKMIGDLRTSDSDMVWFVTIVHLINFLDATSDPTPAHFAVARDILEESESIDDGAVDVLARDLVNACQKFRKKLSLSLKDFEGAETIPLYQDGAPLLPNRDYLSDYIFEKDQCNFLDLVFSEFIEGLGKEGKKASKQVREESRKRYFIFQELGFKENGRPQFWSLWLNREEEAPSIFGPYLYMLAKVMWNDVSKKKWEGVSSAQLLQKVPVSLFNVMLTTKENTLIKLDKKIVEFENRLPKTNDKIKRDQIKKQLKLARQVRQKAALNFPEDFRFSVYEQYAIYGALKLLHDNNFYPVEFYFKDVLEALHFDRINKKEITEIRKALGRLTKQKFPCYMVYPDKENPNQYIYYDGDEPIFKINELGVLDLNLDLLDSTILKKRLMISVANPALLNNLSNFYSMINSNLLAELRGHKKVSEDDLYFLAFVLREMHFSTSTTTNLHKLCAIMKKTEWLKEGKIKNRDLKRKIKDKVNSMLSFASSQSLVDSFSTEGDVVSISYQKPSSRTPLLT